jgi:hypothetical protein
MKVKTIFILVFTVAILSLFSSFLLADQGTTSAVFLKLEQGVRPIGMGGAYTAAADDVNSVMWNPAGLARVPDIQITFMHTIWFASIFYDYLAACYPAGEIGTFGIGLVYVNSGPITSWDNVGNQGASFTASDLGINLAYGTKINKELSLGATIKLFNETIASSGAFGFAIDLGGLYKLPVKDFTLGVDVENLGPNFGFGEAFMLPIMAKVGVSYTGVKNLLLDLDYIQPIETRGILAVGMEYWYKDVVCLRMGYQYQGEIDPDNLFTDVASPGIMAGFVAGAGVKLDIYEIDYAFRQYGVLDSTHRIGLTLKFK